MVSDGGNRWFLFVCFNASVKSLAVAIIMLVAVEVGMVILWGNKETVFPMIDEFVEGIHILRQW